MMGILATIGVGLSLVGCGGGSQTPQERLIGNWIYSNADGTVGEDIDVKSDGTYVLSVIQVTSATSGNVQEERGTYVATDSQVTTTPQEWSCPGPDPVSTMQYSFSGDILVISGPTGLLSLNPNTAPASSGVAITFGCFQSDGSFVAEALAPVSN
jgi:hypothetical protein